MKTVKEWLETLPDGYRDRALSQASPDRLKEETDTLSSAILRFIPDWTDTKEGWDFWDSVDDWAEDKTNSLPPLPNDGANYDFINPKHYQAFDKEVWEMMVDIWGKEAYIKHCQMCAFKYKLRAGSKPEQSVERDLEKADWYLDKAKELNNG